MRNGIMAVNNELNNILGLLMRKRPEVYEAMTCVYLSDE
jgi:hypothetical protein